MKHRAVIRNIEQQQTLFDRTFEGNGSLFRASRMASGIVRALNEKDDVEYLSIGEDGRGSAARIGFAVTISNPGSDFVGFIYEI